MEKQKIIVLDNENDEGKFIAIVDEDCWENFITAWFGSFDKLKEFTWTKQDNEFVFPYTTDWFINEAIPNILSKKFGEVKLSISYGEKENQGMYLKLINANEIIY
jgi:hypothetical protein